MNLQKRSWQVFLLAFFWVSPVLLHGEESIEELRKKAEQGDAEAQYNLGGACKCGSGVPKDKVQSVNWYRKAAEQGHAEAQWFLGMSYKFGSGVVKNEVEALRWYRKSAEQGHLGGQMALADCYAGGIGGIVKNDAEAAKWYCKRLQNKGGQSLRLPKFVLR